MNATNISDFFKVENVNFNFTKSIRPFKDIFDGYSGDKNKERFNQLDAKDKSKVLNLCVYGTLSHYDTLYISVVFDSVKDVYVIFYNEYNRNYKNYSSFIEVKNDETALTQALIDMLTNEKLKLDPDHVASAVRFTGRSLNEK